jgi:hypothetical protein
MQFNEYHSTPVYVIKRRKYGLFRFMCDLLLVGLTSGLWLIWIFVREMRNL